MWTSSFSRFHTSSVFGSLDACLLNTTLSCRLACTRLGVWRFHMAVFR